MKCGNCGGDMEQRLVTYTEDLGNCVVVVRNVPAMVCAECGVVWYSGAVIKQLEAVVDDFTDTAIQIAVVQYQNQVA